jgi:hypothetical protein
VAAVSAYSYAQTMRRPFRLNRRRVLSLGLMVAALLGGMAYLNGVGQQPTYPVLMAAPLCSTSRENRRGGAWIYAAAAVSRRTLERSAVRMAVVTVRPALVRW